MSHLKMFNILQDFKSGPLDYYRKKASFDWKKLRTFIETEEVIEFQNELYEALQKAAEYQTDSINNLTIDEQRRASMHQYLFYKTFRLASMENALKNLKFPGIVSRTLMQLAPSSTIKFGATDSLFSAVIRSMGTKRHEQFLHDAEDGKIFGSYSLTEIGHGSNVKGMQTTATFNKEKQVFIMNSANFESAKCWAASLGQTATHAVVYAKLIVDAINYGLHAFIVPLRDTRTLLPFAGVILGDMGEKIGLNGIDNGFLIFNNYEIPRENLLNKIGDVTENGEYITGYKDPSKKHGATLGALSAGRVTIVGIAETYGSKALTIAIRYAGVRKQFGPTNEIEIPILEYPVHQYRLLPHLAGIYLLRIHSINLSETCYQFMLDSLFQNDKETLAERGTELHGISSGSKAVAGWMVRDAIQECRESCGGHGYLKASGIGELRNDHDANLTYEGENHVLIQQNSNWLLKIWPLILNGEQISTPQKSADFLSQGTEILKHNFLDIRNIQDMCLPKNIIFIFQWLTVYLLDKTYSKLQKDLKNNDLFSAKNANQVFYAKNLSIAFIQHYMLQTMLNKIHNEAPEENIKNVLEKLFALYALYSIEKQHLPSLFQSGLKLPTDIDLTNLVQESILKLCGELKNDAISLVDVIAPPDFALNSVLGVADGEVYKALQSALFRAPSSLSRPSWWPEIINWTKNRKSKL